MQDGEHGAMKKKKCKWTKCYIGSITKAVIFPQKEIEEKKIKQMQVD